MKRMAIVKTEAKPPVSDGNVITAQKIGDDILNLNVWKGRTLMLRYGINLETYEHECLHMQDMDWTEEMFMSGMGYNPWYYGCTHISETFDTEQDLELVKKELQICGYKNSAKTTDIIYDLYLKESQYGNRKRILKEERRQKRIQDVMDRIPDLPDDFMEWMYGKISGGQEYAFYDKEPGVYFCTGCNMHSKKLITEDGKEAKHNQMAECPHCKRSLIVKKRGKQVQQKGHAMLLQVCDPNLSVARHFNMTITWTNTGAHVILSESVRITMFKNDPRRKTEVDLYYNQYPTGYDNREYDSWDNIHNGANRTMFTGYLYPGAEIETALSGTRYAGWSRLFRQLAEAGERLNYNRCMFAGSKQNLINMIEYLFKGRFYRLMRESAESIAYFDGAYHGELDPSGQTAKEVFNIGDQQKINRIRDVDGGESICNWMRWSDETGEKIPQETLFWLEKEDVTQVRVKFILDQMSLTQIMNYVKKQQEGGYRGKTAKAILSQWEDYLSMCKRQKKDVTDEMVYRPRELKRRHAEIVEEIRKEDIIKQMKADRKAKREQARKMREKYPGAEENLQEIRSRYEYQNEEYMVIVPQHLIEIVMEGNALHHCVGSSERYFERIMRRETYICFLRRTKEPKIPFYTLEVEPGGTIRQHRGMYDEEPGIEEIRGFLKEWQRVIKKRMTEEDKRLAGVSRILREKNLEELREKKNERVLKALMEDFMEAM